MDVIILAPHCGGSKIFEIIHGMKVYRFRYFFPAKFQYLAYDGGILPNLKERNLAKIQVPLFLISEFISTLRIVRRERIDVIHTHWVLPNGLIGAFCKKIFGIPHITTAHAGDVFTIEKSKFLKIFGSFVLKSADVITANSGFTKNSIVSIEKSVNDNVQIIPMGVDKQRFMKKGSTRAPLPPATILTIGRLVEKKGIKFLIMAMEIVVKAYPDAKLIIGGDGPERENLVTLRNSLKLEKNVEFTGFIPREKISSVYASADIFVLPSIEMKSGDTEGLGVVLLEAMASGVPVVGSNTGGIVDIIEDRKTGLLVKPGDTNDLADKLLILLSNEDLRNTLSANATHLIDNKFSWDIVTEKFSRIIWDLSKSTKRKNHE